MGIIIFFAVLALLVLTHEFGHFISAKISGVKVEEFGFGFPPRILGFKKGETIYSLNLIPFGGFVRIYGEDEVKTEDKDKKNFANQKIYRRALIIAAGVLFNLFLLWPVLTVVYFIGAPVSADDKDFYPDFYSERGVMILQVQKNTPAESAGFKEGDYLLRFHSQGDEIMDVKETKEVQDFIAENAGYEITVDYSRAGKIYFTKTIPSLKPEDGKGSLGILMDKIGFVRLPLHLAALEGIRSSGHLIELTARSFALFFTDIFTERKMVSQVAGPVGIAGLVSSAANTGFVFVLQLIALLSVNLAFINLFPFPALDGGRLLFLAIEYFRGKPVSQKTAAAFNNVGFAFLIALMLFITYRDILRLF